jgi:hypothetical protein
MPDSITPPPELVTSLRNSAPHGIRAAGVTRELWLINSAYAAGADQELEACCRWTAIVGGADALRAARRPQPPTLKEQAMRVLVENGTNLDGRMELDSTDIDTIRRALEALPND